MPVSDKKEGDRDDPLLILDQFMDFLKENTKHLTVPSIDRINDDIGEIEDLGRKAESLNGLKSPIPDRERIRNDVEEIERIASTLDLRPRINHMEYEEDPVENIHPKDRYFRNMRRSIPPVFGAMALLAYAIVCLRVLFDLEIPRLLGVVADPNYIFGGILVLLIITMIINGMHRLHIHLKVRRLRLSGEIPGGDSG